MLVSLLFLGAVGCEKKSCTTCLPPEELEFAPFLGMDLAQMTKTASGLYYQDLVVGNGELALAGDSVTVIYSGWIHNGILFDTNVGGEPTTFDLEKVIPGWSEGIPGMRVGGKRKLVIPPGLAYGKSGLGPIPGNATLVFDVELVGLS